MEAKFGNFSELANLLSVKSRVSSDLTVLFERFSLGRLLSRMGIRKEQGYSLVQLIMAKMWMKTYHPCTQGDASLVQGLCASLGFQPA